MKLLVFLLLIIGVNCGNALTNYAEIYPPLVQILTGTTTFKGDRKGCFKGDSVAVLSDGSAWKVHPSCEKEYEKWMEGDTIRISARTKHYWFKREHKFFLNNETRHEKVKAMFVQNKDFAPQITSIDSYSKSSRAVYTPHTVYWTDNSGQLRSNVQMEFSGYKPTDCRKVLVLSDGSVWVIKNKLSEFQLGMYVYIGAQARAGKFFDFPIIIGNEQEAIYTFARPQK